MKKLMAIVFGLVLCTSTVYAAQNIEVSAGPTAHFYADSKDSVGVGANVDVVNAFGVENLRVGTGLESVTAETPFSVGVPGSSFSAKTGFITTTGKLADGRAAGSFNLDIVDWSDNVGYDFHPMTNLTVTPVVGLDVFFVNADNTFTASNEIGAHIGGKATYAVTKNISLSGNLGYQWGSTNVELSADNGNVGTQSQHVSLNNFYVGTEVKVLFS